MSRKFSTRQKTLVKNYEKFSAASVAKQGTRWRWRCDFSRDNDTQKVEQVMNPAARAARGCNFKEQNNKNGGNEFVCLPIHRVHITENLSHLLARKIRFSVCTHASESASKKKSSDEYRRLSLLFYIAIPPNWRPATLFYLFILFLLFRWSASPLLLSRCTKPLLFHVSKINNFVPVLFDEVSSFLLVRV